MPVISSVVRERIEAAFPASDWEVVERLLVQSCTTGLPLACGEDARFFERIHCAVIELSEGRIDVLKRWIGESHIDWRDVLVVAGFADSPTAHLKPRAPG